MTQDTLIGSKLIVEVLYKARVDGITVCFLNGKSSSIPSVTTTLQELKFHSDLNWLAEAVRKFCLMEVKGWVEFGKKWTSLEIHKSNLMNARLIDNPIKTFERLVSACKFLKENQTNNSES